MSLSLVVVDAFTTEAFRGNPAAVTVLEPGASPSDQRMQEIARELSLSETAFLRPRGAGHYDLRWFTPTVEVDLCGHATLASAHVVGTPAMFHTRSGELRCDAGEDGLILMDFPRDPPVEAEAPDGVLPEALAWLHGRLDLHAELPSADAVRSLVPDLTAIAALDCRGLIVTAPGDKAGVDCVSRFFAPQSGVPEDPVTGSAHATIAEVWSARTARTDLVGEQASARGGIVHMSLRGERIRLGGHAVTVSEVHLLV
jgi:predicted PhzF superfamily epimerase YddE/YHI9